MKVINNFTNESFNKDVLRENEELLYENVWRSNLGWQKEIVSNVGLVLIRNLSEQQKDSLKNDMIRHQLIASDTVIELDAQAYLWQRFSFIPWHSDKISDDEVRYAATLYLNSDWKDDWGGLLLYKKSGIIYGESPSFNKLAFNDKNYYHATSIVSGDAPFRHTIQLFWKTLR